MKYRVGIVGCGNIARVHAAVLHDMPTTQLTACVDIRAERAQNLAQQYGCRAYESLADMLEGEKLDAVHICTPHYLHAPMAEEIASRGIAVFCEKPPVISREQWASLERADRLAPLGFCFQNRYNPNFRELKSIIREKRYGEVLGARAFVTWDRGEDYYLESGWRGSWATEGGGVLINQTIHTLDLLVKLLGKPETVRCTMVNHHLAGKIEVEDTLNAWMTVGGHPVLFYATTAYSANSPVMIEVQMEKAAVRLEGAKMEIITKKEKQQVDFDETAALGKGYWGSGHAACIADFYACLSAKVPFANDLRSVCVTVDVMLEMYAQNRPTT